MGPGKRAYYLQTWDVQHENPIKTMDCQREEPGVLAASPDGYRLLAGFPDGTVRIFAL
jgi:hypothetical protein